MSDKGMLMSVRRTITRLECLQEKFLRDDTTDFITGEIRKMKNIEEKLVNEIKKKDIDNRNRRKKT